jgi:hypothetical protein
MTIKFTILQGQTIQPASASNVVARAGIAANTDPASTIYQFAIGQDPVPALVAGPLASDCAYASTWGGAQHIAVKVPATTAGTISSVTKPGGSTSPTPAITGSSFDSVSNSPYGAYNLALRFSGGLPGVCSVDVALDGASYDYTFPMPPSLPATLRGTVDVTGFTYSSLNGLTLRWKVDGGSILTVTFTTPTTEADVVAAFAAQAITAVFVQVGDKRYLEVRGVAPGVSGSSLAFMGGGAEDLLGFTPGVAVQRSTVDLVGFTFSSLDNETLIFNPDGTGNVTATMGATVTNEADVLSAFSGHATLAAYIVHVGAHHYLEVAALTPGTGGTNTLVCGNGTANTNLGFTNATSTTGKAAGNALGVDSSITIPATGLKVAFPYGTYLAEVHTATTTGPRHSQADLDTALAALNARLDLAFGLVEVVQEALDATSLLSLVGDTDATSASWEAQPNKRFVHFLVAAPRTASDSSVAGALVSQSSRYTTAAARWTYVNGPAGTPKGSFPHSLVRPLATRCAAIPFSEDPGFGGFGPLPGCSMIGPDGTTMAPDENTATVKLGTSRGPGYTVVKGKAVAGRLLPFIVRGVTRAGQSSLFVDLGVTRMVLRAAAIIYAALQDFENPTFDLQEDGTIQEHEAISLEDAWRKALIDELVPTHASSADVAVERTENIAQTRNLTVHYTVQERGQGEDITVTLTLTGTITGALAVAA